MQHRGWPEGYREIVAPSALTTAIQRFWAYAIPPTRVPEEAIVVPDGCADIIWVDDAPPVVVGPMTVPAPSWPVPGSHVVGVRLRPGMPGLVLREDVAALTDQEVLLAALWGDRASRELTDPLLDSKGYSQSFSWLALALTTRIASAPVSDPAVMRAIDWLRWHPRGRLSALTDEVGISERQLRRRFASAVGYGPKTFQRIMRVQHCLAVMQSGQYQRGDLATLALEMGFADQAHLTRELQRLTGRTPGATTPAHATGWLE